MKFLQTAKGQLVFQLGKREKRLLLQVLNLYPCLPPAHQPLSKSAALPDQEASQHLLEEALSEQRAENKKQVQALLADPQRLTENPLGWLLTLTPVEVEWLLQVLNDIRVGSWVLLGSPEQGMALLNEQTAPHIWAMESAG
ncbi:MAG TPA: hypothetical protein VNT26_05145, partial [Candidatus Sulfotelmatobacter sp.]|nr:hypothetical protein [Candidatus Sulfotelmatobacter sp.]